MNENQLLKRIRHLEEKVDVHIASQQQINAETIGQLAILKLWKKRLPKMFICLRRIVEKYKKQKIEAKLLSRLLIGGIELKNLRCECGRKIEVNRLIEEKRKPTDDFPERQRKNEYEDIPKEQDTQTNGPFGYSTDLQNMINQPLPSHARRGFIMGLDDGGCCEFDPHNYDKPHLNSLWNQISRGQNSSIGSRFILLPDRLSGLIILVQIFGNPSRELWMRLFPYDTPHNKTVSLPRKIKLEVEVESLTNSILPTSVHEFIITEFGKYASEDNFYIPLHNLNRNIFPNISLKFDSVEDGSVELI